MLEGALSVNLLLFPSARLLDIEEESATVVLQGHGATVQKVLCVNVPPGNTWPRRALRP